MTRLRSHLALGLLPAANLAALPFPKDPGPPLPDGAVRRFGQAPPEPPGRPRPAAMPDDGDVVNTPNSSRRAAMASPTAVNLIPAAG